MRTYLVPVQRTATNVEYASLEIPAATQEAAIAEALRQVIEDDIAFSDSEPEYTPWEVVDEITDITPVMEHDLAEQVCIDNGVEFKEDGESQWMWRQPAISPTWHDTGTFEYEHAVQAWVRLAGRA